MDLPITYRQNIGTAADPMRTRELAAVLRPGSRSGTWNVWPTPRGNALETRITADRAARRWPEHADAILSRPDSTD